MPDSGERDIKQNGKCYAQRQAEECRGDLGSSILKNEKSLGQAVSTPHKGKEGGKRERAKRRGKNQTGRVVARVSIRGWCEAEGGKGPCVNHWESAKTENTGQKSSRALPLEDPAGWEVDRPPAAALFMLTVATGMSQVATESWTMGGRLCSVGGLQRGRQP